MKISSQQKLNFFNELKTYYSAGYNLIESLDFLQTNLGQEIKGLIKRGEKLSCILEKYNFELEVIYLLRSGEKNGEMKTVIETIVRHYETRKYLKDKIWHLLLYPLITLIFSLLIVIFFIFSILPRFKVVYASMGIVSSEIFSGKNILIVFLILLVVIVIFFEKIKKIFLNNKYLLYYQNIYLFYFLGLLWQQTDISLFLNQIAVNNSRADKLYKLAFYLKKGCNLSFALEKLKLMDRTTVLRLQQAEKANRVKQVLIQLAGEYEQNFIKKIESILLFAEPLLIVIVGVFIGCLSVQIILPVVHLTQNLM